MNDFFWTSGHLGWGIFALLVFSGLWLLMADLVWRLFTVKTNRLAAIMGVAWLAVIAIICLASYFLNL